MISDDTEDGVNKVTLKQFLVEPERFIREAAAGEYVAVSTGHGTTAIIIDDVEWTMLRQALVLCMEHPEWTISSK